MGGRNRVGKNVKQRRVLPRGERVPREGRSDRNYGARIKERHKKNSEENARLKKSRRHPRGEKHTQRATENAQKNREKPACWEKREKNSGGGNPAAVGVPN